VRQKDSALKSAVELLPPARPTGAIDLLQQPGRIREIPDPKKRIRIIARRYAESPDKTLMIGIVARVIGKNLEVLAKTGAISETNRVARCA
jgi:hypothetical protein